VTPFQRETDAETESYILSVDVCFPSEQETNISDDCKQFIIHLLNKSEKERNAYHVETLLAMPWLKRGMAVIDSEIDLVDADYEKLHSQFRDRNDTVLHTMFTDSINL
jgi:hypothetical protein